MICFSFFCQAMFNCALVNEGKNYLTTVFNEIWWGWHHQERPNFCNDLRQKIDDILTPYGFCLPASVKLAKTTCYMLVVYSVKKTYERSKYANLLFCSGMHLNPAPACPLWTPEQYCRMLLQGKVYPLLPPPTIFINNIDFVPSPALQPKQVLHSAVLLQRLHYYCSSAAMHSG